MTFRNHPFPESTDLFPRASDVCDYLVGYARTYGVDRYVRFDTTVTRVWKVGEEWVIRSRRRRAGGQGGAEQEEEREERFDFVSIANGHYEKVMIPEIPGLK